MKRACVLPGVLASLALLGARAGAQSWRASASELGTTARVLLIGARPDDEDNALIAWLSLGRNVETAYLSLTRGEGGVNVNGTERRSSLAVVRTAELLAERQRDGAHQYFTRAYDFGHTAVDSVVDRLWPRDSLLRDVVSVVRAFRPHVMIYLSAGPGERDAAGRLTAGLAASAFALAADSIALPTSATSRLPAWTVSRLFTRVDSAAAAAGVAVAVDVGEFDRALGRSYAEIGADIRKLQRSQPPVQAPEPGTLRRWLRLDSTGAGGRATVFGTIDTTLFRFGGLPREAEAQLDTLRAALGDVRAVSFQGSADSVAAALARVAKRTSDVRLALLCSDVSAVPMCEGALGDLAVALNTIRERANRAMLAAAGLVIDANAARELVAAGDSVPVAVTVYNRGGVPVTVRRLAASAGNVLSMLVRDSNVVLQPDSVAQWSASLHVLAPSHHWWQINGLMAGTMLHDFGTSRPNTVVGHMIVGEDRIIESRLEATVALGGVDVPIILQPLLSRTSTALRGDDRHPLAGVPPTSVLFERIEEYERAGLPIDRLFHVYVWSARSTPDTLAVTLIVPPGLQADSVTRTVVLPPFGARDVFFRLHGTLRPGSDTVRASVRSVASASGRSPSMVRVGSPAVFNLGVVTHEYPHIPAQQFVRFALDRFEVVDVRLPPRLNVAYVRGTDDLATPLGQLQVKFKTLDPSLLSVVDLSGFSTVLLGAGALFGDAMSVAVPALRAFLQGGGTVVVLPRRDDIGRSGLLPYPIAFDPTPVEVTDPASDVRITDAKSQLLNWPNALSQKDFADWSGRRARGVPASFDPRYHTVLTTGDTGQPSTPATILIARVGKGTIVYTSLSVDEQLASANPGAARLMINLLSAGLFPGAGR